MLVEQFENFPPDESDILFLGNSITFWGNWKERLNDFRIKNQGIPGDITFGVLERIKKEIIGTPKTIFILIGINDIGHHIPDSIIIRNYKRIIRKIREICPATEIYFQTLLPTNPSFGALTSLYHHNKDILKINSLLRNICNEEGIGFIDLYTNFVDEKGELIEKYTWDGVHLTQKGYDRWVEILKRGHYLQSDLIKEE